MNCYYFGFLVFLFLFVNSCDIEYDVNYLLIINYYYVIVVVFIYVNKFEDVYFDLYLCNLECQGRNVLLINFLDQ